MVMPRKILSPFGYYGGKQSFLKFLYPHLPQKYDGSFLESHVGSGVVTWNREPTKQEHINDRSKRLITFYRVVRSEADLPRLVESVYYTPYAEDEFEYCLHEDDQGVEDIEVARRFVVVNGQSIGSLGKSWSIKYRAGNKIRSGVVGFNAEDLERRWKLIAYRLRQYGHIHNKDCVDFIERLDHPDAMLYVDPPYIGHDKEYIEATDHNALADALHQFAGYVVISGYQSDDMEELYGDWSRIDNAPKTSAMSNTKQGGKLTKRIESIWINKDVPVGDQT